MSTFWSCPSPFFLTFTLQAGSASSVEQARTRASRELASCKLSLGMLRSSLRGLRPLDAGAALSDVGNADRQMSVYRDFAKKSFDSADLRDCGVGKGAKIILDREKILTQQGISHGQDGSLLRGTIENRLQHPSPGSLSAPGVG